MPLEQRVIKPILISRSSLPLDSQGNPISIPNELECVTNGTLANIIRQLSSLSKYAEDLFAGILHEATLLIARSTSLQGRIDRLSVRVTQLDSSVEEVSLKDIQLRKPFKSCASYDQQVVARTTMPESIKEVYMSCDRPPPLEKLNAYRDDGKDGLKFYTDPNYFFELWAKEMLEVTEKEKSGKKNAHRGPNKGQGDLGPSERRRGKPRQPQNTARDIMAKIPATEFIDTSRLQQQQNLHQQQQIYQHPNGLMQGTGHYGQPQHYSQTLERPRSLGFNQYQVDGYHHMDQINMPQAIPNHPPPAYYPPGSIMNQNPYHTGNMGNQVAVNQITSPDRGSHTPPPSYFATPGSATGDSIISINQIPGSQQNQGTPTRRINAQGSAASVTARPSQPPPAPPSNPPSSNSSTGGTPTIGTPSRSRGQSLTRESLPPPPPPPPPPSNSGMNGVVRGDSLDSELPLPPPTGEVAVTASASQQLPTPPSDSTPSESLPTPTSTGVNGGDKRDSPDADSPLTTTIVRDDLTTEPKRSRKRMKLTPEDLLDRNSITLYHLIHASITRTKKNDKKKPNEKKTDESMDENIETNSEAGSKGLSNSPETSGIDNEDTMDSIMTSASTIITNDPAVEEEPQERESIGPRVKVGPDGQLILDEESLVIKKPKPIETTSIEEVVSGKTTYASFRKRPPTARWSKAETIEFYTALNLIGPDFSLMSNLFFNGKRTRTDLKNKFRRENKLNKHVIEKALYEADVEYCLAREAVQADHS